MKKKLLNPRNMTKIAILSVIAFILMYFQFPLPFIAPPFYQVDFSEIPVLIGGFAISPLAALVIELLKNLLNVIFEGSTTAFVGELSNFIVGCAYTVTAAYIYQKNKTKQGALLALTIGTLIMTAVGFVSNLFFVIPAYVNFMHLPLESIIGMAKSIFPFIDSTFMMVLLCTTPFNLIKGLINSVITALIYKHISPLLKRF